MKPELHHESAKAFGLRHCDLRLDFREGLVRGNDIVFALCGLQGFESFEPLRSTASRP
jgi:hypothetical protein